MYRAGLIVIAALGLSAIAAPTVFATASADAPLLDMPQPGEPIEADLVAAIDEWCAARDERGCAAWQAEADQPHILQHTQTRGDTRSAWVSLRNTSMRVRVEARQRSTGWGIEAVRGERTLRCGTPAFGAVRDAVRRASPAWSAWVDGCAPDALRPIEIERAALRPVLIRGEKTVALVHGPETLALTWQAGAWQAAR